MSTSTSKLRWRRSGLVDDSLQCQHCGDDDDGHDDDDDGGWSW